MAKSRTKEPPQADRGVQADECMVVRVPFEALTPGEFTTRHVEVRLDHQASNRLKEVLKGLRACNAKLRNGRHVDRPAHVVAFLLENLTAEKSGPDSPDSSTGGS